MINRPAYPYPPLGADRERLTGLSKLPALDVQEVVPTSTTSPSTEITDIADTSATDSQEGWSFNKAVVRTGEVPGLISHANARSALNSQERQGNLSPTSTEPDYDSPEYHAYVEEGIGKIIDHLHIQHPQVVEEAITGSPLENRYKRPESAIPPPPPPPGPHLEASKYGVQRDENGKWVGEFPLTPLPEQAEKPARWQRTIIADDITPETPAATSPERRTGRLRKFAAMGALALSSLITPAAAANYPSHPSATEVTAAEQAPVQQHTIANSLRPKNIAQAVAARLQSSL